MTENEALAKTEDQTLPVGFKDPLVYQARLIAKSDVLPKALQGKPANVYLALMAARDIAGLSEFTATQKLYVIDGKFAMYAELQRALVMAHEKCDYMMLISNDGKEATWETKRDGYPKEVRWTYSLEDAKQAGLLSKDNWRKHTKDMLNARASAALCRLVYPDILMGLSYSVEELRDGVVPMDPLEVEVEPVQAPVEDQLAVAIAAKAKKEAEAQKALAAPKKKPKPRKSKAKDSAEAAAAVAHAEELEKAQEAAESAEAEEKVQPPQEAEKDAPEPAEEQGEAPQGHTETHDGESHTFMAQDDIEKLIKMAKKNGYAEAALRRYCMHLADGLDLEDAPLHMYHKLFKWAAEPKEKE
jgi:hypothetical protein